jgi:hypothetical protein
MEKSKEYKEGYAEGKLNLKRPGMGYVNPYLNPKPSKEDYKKFIEWNLGYRAALAEVKDVTEPKPKKKTVKKKVAKKKTKAKKVKK